jgi:hypothetical protein
MESKYYTPKSAGNNKRTCSETVQRPGKIREGSVVLKRACMAALIVGTGTLYAGVSLSLTAQTRPVGDRPNIIFILADDVSFCDLSVYGQTRWDTPRLDALAVDRGLAGGAVGLSKIAFAFGEPILVEFPVIGTAVGTPERFAGCSVQHGGVPLIDTVEGKDETVDVKDG